MTGTPEDFLEAPDNGATYIVNDTKAALKIKVADQRAAEAKYRAVVKREKEIKRAEARNAKFSAKFELARLRLEQTAESRARAHIAVAGPAYLLILIGGFICALATGAIPEDSISVASALLTLLVTGLMQNLRSIIAGEGNGHGTSKKDPKKDPSKTTSKKD